MNEYPKVLVLGDGLLGSEIVKQTDWEYLSTKQDGIDVVKDFEGLTEMIINNYPDVVVNCIGYTDTYSKERQKHWDINYEFVANLVRFCDTEIIKLVQVSTDYVYGSSEGGSAKKETDIPVHQNTWYAYTKLLSDACVQLNLNHLIFRCSFKPKPFPYEKAYANVRGNFDYVDVIAGQMIELIKEDRQGVWNIGTEFKSVYELAVQTKPDIGSWHNDKLPTIQMDLTKFKDRIND